MKKRNIWKSGLPIFLLLTISILLGIHVFDEKIDMNGDNTSYYALAKSLSQFKGYVDSFGLKYTPHSHFPPGYPFILAPFMWISTNLMFIKSISTLFYAITIVLGYLLLNHFNPNNRLQNFFISLVLATNYHLLKYSTIIMSEMALIMTNMIFIFIFSQNKNKWKDDFKPDLSLILLSFIGILAYHIKTLAIPLIGSAFIFFLLNRKFKLASKYLILNIIFFLPYFIRNKIQGVKGGYLGELVKINPYRPELGNLDFSGFIDRIGTNLVRYIGKEIPHGILAFSEVSSQNTPPAINIIFGTIGIAIILFGWWKLEKIRAFILMYLGGSFIILLVWPEVWFGIRFMLSLIPLLIILFSLGIIHILSLKPFIKIKNWLFYPIFSLFIALNIGWVQEEPLSKPTVKFLNAYSKADYPNNFKNYIDVAQWAKNNLPKGTPIACRKPGIFHTFYDGPALGYPQVPDQNEFIRLLVENQTYFIVIDQLGYSSTARFVVPVVQNNPELFRVIYKTEKPETYLVEFLGR
jgi:hypothetical protein